MLLQEEGNGGPARVCIKVDTPQFYNQFTTVGDSVILLLMNKVADAFRKAERTTPGWNKAKEIVVALNSVADPSSLEWEQKTHLITLAMQAATQSEYWVEFLIAVSDVLTCPHMSSRDENAQNPEPD